MSERSKTINGLSPAKRAFLEQRLLGKMNSLGNGTVSSQKPRLEMAPLAFRSDGDGTPLFLFHYLTPSQKLAKHLGSGRPVYGVDSAFEEEMYLWEETGEIKTSVEELAARCLVELQQAQPKGPYFLAGFCFGGVLAFEVANRLRKQGEEVAFLGLLDSFYLPAVDLRFLPWLRANSENSRVSEKSEAEKEQLRRLAFMREIIKTYRGEPYSGRAVLFRAIANRDSRALGTHGWNEVLLDGVQVEDCQCTRGELFENPFVIELGARLAQHLSRADAPPTPNGKMDRKALPAPEANALTMREYEAPQGEVETILAEMWAELLKVERIGRHDNFFELGGHSLLAVMLMERMRRKGLHADVRTLFRAPTIAEAAAAVGSQSRLVEVPLNLIPAECNAITPEMLSLVELSATEIEGIVSTIPGGASNVQDIYPLAPLQEGIFFHHVMAGERDPYVVAMLHSFDSRARLDGYLLALQAVMDRHDILRTSVVWEGLREPVQVVWRKAPMPVEEIQLDPMDGDVAEQLKRRFAPPHHRIDIRRAPLYRAYVTYDVSQERWLLLTLFHHLAGDHVTLEVMNEEIQAHLLGQQKRLPAPVPFRNFVAQARLGVSQEEHQRFFRQMLGDVDEPTLPFGLLNVYGNGSEIEEARLEVDEDLARRIRERARKLGVSAASLCHLAWVQVLARVSGHEEVVFGTVLFGRMQAGEGGDRVPGPFINTLPVRIRVGEEGVEASARATHSQLAELLRYEHCSLALAQRCSAIPAPSPLFSALLNYRHSPGMAQAYSAQAMGAWEGIQRLYTIERTSYPLYLSVSDLGKGFILTAQVSTPVGPMRVCEYMHTALEGLIEALEKSPAQATRNIEVLPGAERRQMLTEWNDTRVDYPGAACLHKLFEAQAQRTPEAVAVTCDSASLTYGELNRRANQLARYLQGLGVGAGALVGVCTERSLEMVVGLLAVLKAGGAYVPLDPAYPMERLAFILRETQVPVVMTQGSIAGTLPSCQARVVCLDDSKLQEEIGKLSGDDCQVLSSPDPSALAYVIYTSGSTGQPKGVEISHRAVVNFLNSMRVMPGIAAQDTLLSVTTLSFDIFGLELWLPLSTGAQVVIAPQAVTRDGRELAALMRQSRATVMQATPSTWRLLLESGWEGDVNLKVLCGGEAWSPQLAEQLLAKCGSLWNMYGPTETTIWSAVQRVEQGKPVVLGHPIANTRFYVVDGHLRPVPVGVAGELLIGGEGLARGYLKRAELTAEKFIVNPFSTDAESRLYRTGDLVRYLPDGTLEFLGRLDHQVKLRGFRIELGEIEAALREYPGVSQCVVTARENEAGDKRLVAYIVPSDPQNTSMVAELRELVKQKLPDYMVPAAFVTLEKLPLTPNGKINHKALPASELGRASSKVSYVAARTPVEEALAEIWAKVLGIKEVGLQDNFFDLGGHSLLATRLIAEVHKSLDQTFSVIQFFKAPTIEAMARVLEEEKQAEIKEKGRLYVVLRGGAKSLAVIPKNAGFIEVQTAEGRPPFFIVDGFPYFIDVVKLLGTEQPVVSLIAQQTLQRSSDYDIAEEAAVHVQTILGYQPQGPYMLGGSSASGIVAYEVAQQLQTSGHQVGLLVLFDTVNPYFMRLYSDIYRSLVYHKAGLKRLGWADVPGYIAAKLVGVAIGRWNRLKRVLVRGESRILTTPQFEFASEFEYLSERIVATRKYRPRPYTGKVLLVKGHQELGGRHQDARQGWGDVVDGEIEVCQLSANEHIELFKSELDRALVARKLRSCFDAVAATVGSLTSERQAG